MVSRALGYLLSGALFNSEGGTEQGEPERRDGHKQAEYHKVQEDAGVSSLPHFLGHWTRRGTATDSFVLGVAANVIVDIHRHVIASSSVREAPNLTTLLALRDRALLLAISIAVKHGLLPT